jgi:hypothetical protein
MRRITELFTAAVFAAATIWCMMVILGLTGCGQKPKDGAPGAVGPQGTEAVSPYVVQFCPGVTAQYPSVFPESGICLSGQIWAVYSTNDGYGTLIPPGVYESTAVGSSCTFTVGPNCEVSQ